MPLREGIRYSDRGGGSRTRIIINEEWVFSSGRRGGFLHVSGADLGAHH